jgi:tetratricopeptide (TPR) repeat protein
VSVRIPQIAWLGLVAGSMSSGLAAQVARAPDPNTPRMMVLTFRTATPGNTGVQAADALRSRMSSEVPYKQLWQIPNTEINAVLEASGYRKDEPLSSNDARELGRQLRADEFVQGFVRRDGETWRIEATLHLVRDPSLAQPLTLATAPKAGDAAKLIAAELVEARKQLVPERTCVNAARDKNWDKAMASAREGIALFPKAVIARTCLLNAMFETKATDEAQLAMAEEILALDGRSRRALSIAGDIYRRRNVANPRDTANANKMIQAYTGLIAADPTNTRLVDDVTKAIAGAGNPGVALPIIRKAVEENPGDAALMRTQFLVELAARETKAALRTGTELAALDTAMADTSYFFRMAAAYSADSQPAKAAEEIAKGVAKFPGNASLLVVAAQAQRAAGQTQQAVETLKRALAMDANVEKGQLQLAQLYNDLKQPDSAYAALLAADKGADSALVGDVALDLGNKAQREVGAKTDAVDADYLPAVNFLTMADANATSTERKQQAKFLLGVVNVRRGQALLRVGGETRNCVMVKAASEQFIQAQLNVPAGGRFSPQAAGQLMEALGKLIPAATQTEKAVCKP